jgi:MFS transporter, OFA family, oxalate/formate antiporter
MIKKQPNRWLIATMGAVLQLVLGTVYAWSFFHKPIMETYGWSNVQVMWIFSMTIVFLGLTAALGGTILTKTGPRKLAIVGALLYALGYFISAYAMSVSSLTLFYLGFGAIGGMGLGLGYVTPVATVSRWFPDKKGLVTGMVIMGFGFGALLMSKIIAPFIIEITDGNLVQVFFCIGIILLIIGLPASLFMVNPRADYLPEEYSSPVKSKTSQKRDAGITIKKSLLSGKFLGIWTIFFLNISAGILFIGWQSPMLQDLYKTSKPDMDDATLVAAGATLIAISSVFNGLGRMFWGWISDKLGRIQVFRLILASQVVVFIALMFTSSPVIFMILVCYILLCYGGGFGTMPSYILDVFGARLMPAVYGTILTAWSLGGIVGPQIAASLKDNNPEKAELLIFITATSLVAVGLVVALKLDNKPLSEIYKDR